VADLGAPEVGSWPDSEAPPARLAVRFLRQT